MNAQYLDPIRKSPSNRTSVSPVADGPAACAPWAPMSALVNRAPVTRIGGGVATSRRRPVVIEGRAGSSGTVRGRVRLVDGPQTAAAVQPGDIVVCPTASAMWSPLIAIAGAIVTNAGGVLSPLATLAREHGVPCVISAPTSSLMEDGGLVIVDGGRGLIRLAAGRA